jgi:hypothetical protein
MFSLEASWTSFQKESPTQTQEYRQLLKLEAGYGSTGVKLAASSLSSQLGMDQK